MCGPQRGMRDELNSWINTSNAVSISTSELKASTGAEPKVSGREGSRPGRRYDSAAMQDRKARILEEAQLLLSAVGYDGFTIGELSRRAGVAQRTLYTNLGSKEEIIARAIIKHFDSVLAQMPPFAGRDLASYLDRCSLMTSYAIGLRGYAAAMVSVFFSPGIDARVYGLLEALPLRSFGDFEAKAMSAKILRPLSPPERRLLTRHLPQLIYAAVADWVAGRLSDLELHASGPVVLLLGLYPYLADDARAEADRMMQTYTMRGLARPMLFAP